MTARRAAGDRERAFEAGERLAKSLQALARKKRAGSEGPDERAWWVVEASAEEAIKAIREARRAPGRGPAKPLHPYLGGGDLDAQGVPPKKACN